MLPPRCPIVHVSKPSARRLWLHAQRLDTRMPFGEGPEATAAAVEHLGYVQIDTINVIERAHHHTLWARIPTYRREDLHLPEMRRRRNATGGWFGQVKRED